MKRIGILLTSLIMAVVLFTSCANAADNGSKTVKFIIPNGSPAISVAKLVSEVDKIGDINIEYEIVAGADRLRTALTSNEAQVAIMPTNLASILYNGGAEIKLISVNVYGNVYLVSAHDNVTLQDLKGKTVHSIGQTGTPDVIFKYLLDNAGIEYDNPNNTESVTIEFGAQADFNAKVINGTYEYAIISEPIVTAVMAQNTELKINLDLQEAWADVTEMEGIPQASIVVREDIFTKFPGVVESILQTLADNKEWIIQNPQKANDALFAVSGLNLPPLSGAILERSNVTLKLAKDEKSNIQTYLDTILGFNPQLIGGKLPDAGFYYIP